MARANLTIEELLTIAESGDGVSYSSNRKTDVDNYIRKFNINAGNDKIPAHIIYYHYRQWRKRNYISRRYFFKLFGKVFDRHNGQAFYHLDGDIFDTSLEGSLKARVFLRKERDAKRKRDEKKCKS